MICRYCSSPLKDCRCNDPIVVGLTELQEKREEEQRQGLFNMITILGFGLTLISFMDRKR